VVGIQDMGAAGLTCSTCEMPARGGTGIEIDVARVPRREEGMTAYEVMLSESQERMLLVARKGREEHVKKIFAKWGLNAVTIGQVTRGSRMRVLDHGAVVADIPVSALTTEAPVYNRPVRKPRYLASVQRDVLKATRQPADLGDALLKLLAAPTIASKALVFEQYDHMVQTNTVVLPGRADAAVLRLKGTASYLAATTDANGRYCYLDPYEGGKAAVAEAARNLVCTGAEPLAITDCLNFGSPLDPEIMWQFKECVRGLSDACRAFGTPVTGGNVSLYNQGAKGAVDPTPVVGMIGLITSGDPVTMSFKREGDAVVVLGATREELGGSEYLLTIHGRKAGRPPQVNLDGERALHRMMLDAARQGWLASAHDCSEGGLAVAIAESCIAGDRAVGASIEPSAVPLGANRVRPDALQFGESAGRIVVSCERRYVQPLLDLAAKHGVPAAAVGTVGGTRLRIGNWIDCPVEELADAWQQGLPRALGAA
jgi:phosphoribosylformylglycinamidine synthase